MQYKQIFVVTNDTTLNLVKKNNESKWGDIIYTYYGKNKWEKQHNNIPINLESVTNKQFNNIEEAVRFIIQCGLSMEEFFIDAMSKINMPKIPSIFSKYPNVNFAEISLLYGINNDVFELEILRNEKKIINEKSEFWSKNLKKRMVKVHKRANIVNDIRNYILLILYGYSDINAIESSLLGMCLKQY